MKVGYKRKTPCRRGERSGNVEKWVRVDRTGESELKDWWLGLSGQGRGKGGEEDDVWV